MSQGLLRALLAVPELLGPPFGLLRLEPCLGREMLLRHLLRCHGGPPGVRPGRACKELHYAPEVNAIVYEREGRSWEERVSGVGEMTPSFVDGATTLAAAGYPTCGVCVFPSSIGGRLQTDGTCCNWDGPGVRDLAFGTMLPEPLPWTPSRSITSRTMAPKSAHCWVSRVRARGLLQATHSWAWSCTKTGQLAPTVTVAVP